MRAFATIPLFILFLFISGCIGSACDMTYSDNDHIRFSVAHGTKALSFSDLDSLYVVYPKLHYLNRLYIPIAAKNSQMVILMFYQGFTDTLTMQYESRIVDYYCAGLCENYYNFTSTNTDTSFHYAIDNGSYYENCSSK